VRSPYPARMPAPTACAQHPDVQTRLRCSACETPICPACGREAAVGFKCPPCARHLDATTSARPRSGGGRFEQVVGRANTPRGDAPASRVSGERLPIGTGARATLVGLAAAVLGGLLLSPVLQGGFFFLLTSGAIGWGVARAVYWGGTEVDSPYLRAIALTFAGFTVAVALAFAGAGTAPAGLLFLAYPAAVYGGWIVVRGR
jgi:hypothetical protein